MAAGAEVIPSGPVALARARRVPAPPARQERRGELMCRPQSDRLVIHGGRQVAAELPDYSDLDRV